MQSSVTTSGPIARGAELSESLAYLNGQFLPLSRLTLAPWDAGVVLGATISEISRTFGRRPYLLLEHMERLFQSLHQAGMKIFLTEQDLSDITNRLIDANACNLMPGQELGICHFVTAGPVATYRGLFGHLSVPSQTIGVYTFPLPFELWREKVRAGVRLVTPCVRQIPPECLHPHMKCRSRMHYYLADQQARNSHPEAWALLLDMQGNITEATSANFLMVRGNSLLSAPEPMIFPGISRRVVIHLGKRAGLAFEEKLMTVRAALEADEAFVTSTPYCMLPVVSINGFPVGTGQPGPIFRRLLEDWSQEVGVDIGKQIERYSD
jgi:branched-subunit amino acid aminotransferase/4-amino-4-deoxychorismate lyase